MLTSNKEVLEAFNATFKTPEPKMVSDLSCIVIISGLPTPEASKRKRLLKYVYEHIVKKSGDVAETEHIQIPLDANDACSGFCLIRFVNPSGAEKCVREFNGNTSIFGDDYPLTVRQYSYVEELRKLPKSYTPQPYTPIDCSERHRRLYFPLSGRIDHEFLLLTKTNVSRCAFNGENISIINVQPCADKLLDVSYSPMGTYFIYHYEESIVLVHDNGTTITISHESDSQDTHTFIRSFKVSPCERFLLTFSYTANVDELDEYDLDKFLKDVDEAEDEFGLYQKFEESKHITVSVWSIIERRILSTLNNVKLYSYKNNDDSLVRPEDRVLFSSTGNLILLMSNEQISVYKVQLTESAIYVISLQEVLSYPNTTSLLFSPNGHGQDIVAIYQKSSDKQKPSVCNVLNLNVPSHGRSGVRVLAQRSFFITNGRLFWSANGGCLAIITESQSDQNLVSTIFVIILQGNSESVSYDRLQELAGAKGLERKPLRRDLVVKMEQLELPQNLYIQSACWAATGSMLAFITIPVGSSKEAQEESRKYIKMQKQSNANSLQFSLKALDSFMKHAVDEREMLLNDGQAAIYIFTLQEKYGLYPCKLGKPVYPEIVSGEVVDHANRKAAVVKIKKIPGITASEVMFSPYNDYLVALNRNDRKEQALIVINTSTLEKTSAEIEVVDGCSWDSSGRYLIAHKYGGKSSSFGLYIINVTGMVVYQSTHASLVDNLLNTIWRPYDRELINSCVERSLESIYKYCDENYDKLLFDKTNDSSMKERVEKNKAEWLALYEAETLTADEQRTLNKNVRGCFVLHGLDGNLSGFDEQGNVLDKSLWLENVQETVYILEEVLAGSTIPLEHYKTMYGDADPKSATADQKPEQVE